MSFVLIGKRNIGRQCYLAVNNAMKFNAFRPNFFPKTLTFQLSQIALNRSKRSIFADCGKVVYKFFNNEHYSVRINLL